MEALGESAQDIISTELGILQSTNLILDSKEKQEAIAENLKALSLEQIKLARELADDGLDSQLSIMKSMGSTQAEIIDYQIKELTLRQSIFGIKNKENKLDKLRLQKAIAIAAAEAKNLGALQKTLTEFLAGSIEERKNIIKTLNDAEVPIEISIEQLFADLPKTIEEAVKLLNTSSREPIFGKELKELRKQSASFQQDLKISKDAADAMAVKWAFALQLTSEHADELALLQAKLSNATEAEAKAAVNSLKPILDLFKGKALTDSPLLSGMSVIIDKMAEKVTKITEALKDTADITLAYKNLAHSMARDFSKTWLEEMQTSSDKWLALLMRGLAGSNFVQFFPTAAAFNKLTKPSDVENTQTVIGLFRTSLPTAIDETVVTVKKLDTQFSTLGTAIEALSKRWMEKLPKTTTDQTSGLDPLVKILVDSITTSNFMEVLREMSEATIPLGKSYRDLGISAASAKIALDNLAEGKIFQNEQYGGVTPEERTRQEIARDQNQVYDFKNLIPVMQTSANQLSNIAAALSDIGTQQRNMVDKIADTKKEIKLGSFLKTGDFKIYAPKDDGGGSDKDYAKKIVDEIWKELLEKVPFLEEFVKKIRNKV